MLSFWFYHKRSLPVSICVFALIFLHINIQFCQAFWWSQRPTTQKSAHKPSTPEECARKCKDGEPSKTCYYHFVLEYYVANSLACEYCDVPLNDSRITKKCDCIIGDSFEKTVFSINRMIPGPSIQICKGDYVIIDLQNDAEGLESSLHWHGIFQNGYQYYDGVPYLTQCPVLSSNTFRYQFAADNSGTHFYHSHISVHMIDGQYGSLIVRDPPSLDPHYNSYDEDLKEHVMLISDWIHELSLDRFPGRHRSNLGQAADNILINGRGNYMDRSTGMSTNVSLSTFIIEDGKKYRFRMINACSTVCLIEVTIENHSMVIIATDGENVEPVKADKFIMSSGERIDFILNANQNPGYYWIHARGLGECEEKEVYQLATLVYQGSSTSSLSPMPGYLLSSSGRIFNPLNSTNCGTDLCVDKLHKIYLPEKNSMPMDKPADTNITISFEFGNYTVQSLFNSQDNEYKRFFVSPTGSHLNSLMNNISYKDPPGPPISQGQQEYQYICADNNTPATCTTPCSCTHVYNIQRGALVDVMVYDKKPGFLHHPFHLHGSSFCVLKIGQFDNATNKLEITDDDVISELSAHYRRLQAGAYKYCAPKDTTVVPSTGFAIIRFKADNPGWWLFHCHFAWHSATGMNVVFHVGNPSDLPDVPEDFPKCYNFMPSDET